MKYKSHILILFVVLLSMYCLGKVLPSGITQLFFHYNSLNHTEDSKRNKSRGNKSPEGVEAIISKILSGTEPESYVAIISSNTINPSNRDSSYSIEAFGQIVENGVAVNAGNIVIGNVTMNAGNNNLYHYTYPLSDGKALFGSDVYAGPDDGSSTARMSRIKMVVPREFYPSTLSLPGNTIDRSTAYTLTWAPDPTNQYGKVQIQVSYYKGLSQDNNFNMPNSVQDLVYRVDDNGSFTIPQADLARFPKGSFASISISRVWLDEVSSNVAYVALAEAHTLPLLVVEPVVVDPCTGPPLAIGISHYSNLELCDGASYFRVLTSNPGDFYPYSGNLTVASASGGPIIWSVAPYTSSSNWSWSVHNNTVYVSTKRNDVSLTLRATAKNGCGSVYRDYYFNSGMCNVAMVASAEENSELTISPNPVTQSFEASLKEAPGSTTSITEVVIKDKFGADVKRLKFDGKSKTQNINIQDLPADVYIVQVLDGKKWRSKKIIKQ